MPRDRTKSKATKPKRKQHKTFNVKRKNDANIMKVAPIRGVFSSYGSKDPFKPHNFCTLHYVESTIISVGAIGVFGTEVIYRLNSLFDPRYAVGGAQPYGFDQMSNLYRRYVVDSVGLSIIINDPDRDGLIVGATLQPSLGTATVTGKYPDIIKEQPMSMTRSINNSGDQFVKVNQFIKLADVEGLSPVQYTCDLENYSASVSADPAKSPLVRIAVADGNLGSAGSVQVRAVLKYNCHFFDRITQAQST